MMTRRIDEVRMVKPDADSEGEGVMMIIHNICTSKTYRLLFSKEVFCKNKIDIFVSIYSAIYQPKSLTAAGRTKNVQHHKGILNATFKSSEVIRQLCEEQIKLLLSDNISLPFSYQTSFAFLSNLALRANS